LDETDGKIVHKNIIGLFTGNKGLMLLTQYHYLMLVNIN